MNPRLPLLHRLYLTFLFLLGPAIASAAEPPAMPDGWSDGFVHANGVRLHYSRAAPAPGKPVIVMAHGVTDNGLCRATVTEKLQNDYDIYMLDPFLPRDGEPPARVRRKQGTISPNKAGAPEAPEENFNTL